MLVTSSPLWTQLASRAPCLPGRTTAFLLSYLHHFLRDSFTYVVSDDSKAKSLSSIYKVNNIYWNMIRNVGKGALAITNNYDESMQAL